MVELPVKPLASASPASKRWVDRLARRRLLTLERTVALFVWEVGDANHELSYRS
jgi:hypothetical protein